MEPPKSFSAFSVFSVVNVVAWLFLTGCAQRPVTLRPVSAAGSTTAIESIVRQALALDAVQDSRADALYASDALVVANARIRLGAPRFAGVSHGGKATVASVTVTLQGRFAWAMVDYRWVNVEQRLAEAGRATFVLEEQAGGWKIIHAHSSHLLPWDR